MPSLPPVNLTMAQWFVLTTRRVVHAYYGDEIATQTVWMIIRCPRAGV